MPNTEPSYDFDTIVPRRGTGSYKWDSEPADPDMLPLWVADMDFRAAQPITEALQRRVSHGVFGYTLVTDDYYKAVIDWFRSRHQWDIRREEIIYTSGVVPALSAVIKALAGEGSQVAVMTPVYNCFFSSIRNNGCRAIEVPLLRNGSSFCIDWGALESALADPKTSILLLCNPHNPAGRVWTRAELTHIGDIALRHGVTVVSDEIHCEITFSRAYTPYASLGSKYAEQAVVCISPSKAFNLAGLQIANIVCRREDWRQRIDRAININEVCDVNPFGITATIAAYRHCADWLDAACKYIYSNYLYLCDTADKLRPACPVMPLEGTYLALMDVAALGLPSANIEERLKREAHLWLNAGAMYGAAGEGYLRWNLACPRATLAEAVRRFAHWSGSVPAPGPTS